MKINFSITSILLFSLFVTACAGPTINVANLSGKKYSPTAPDAVEVVVTGNVQRAYQEIAIIEIEEGPGSQTYDEMLQALRTRAGAIGANAVFINTSNNVQGMMPIGGMWMAISGKHIKAIAVRWTDR